MPTIIDSLLANALPPDQGFAPAREGEPIVFGARRPGFPLPRVPDALVATWIGWMQKQGVRRVVCLLPEKQLAGYKDLLASYRDAFGPESVCWAPIADFTLADESTLTRTILPFLRDADRHGERTVVHCSAGIGRTGHVLAAWLVAARGMSNEAAIDAVRRSGRNAREAGDPRLDDLLNACRELLAHS